MKHKGAKYYAVRDIQEELKQESKSFIAFRQNLNTTIRNIVNEYIKYQEKI